MKMHIIGIAGSGKTTLARGIGAAFDAPVFDLDDVVYDRPGREGSRSEVVTRIDEIRGMAQWVTEGAYRDDWLVPCLNGADMIVWLDPPIAVCLRRLILRHVRAELRRNNEHAGWLKLARFSRYTWNTRTRQRTETMEMLAPYHAKVVRCRNRRDIARLKRELASRALDR